MALPGTNPTYQYLDSGFADGTILGQTSSSLVGFYGTTPKTRPAAVTALITTASTSTSSAFGYTTSTQAEAVTTAVNSIIAALQALGLVT